MIVIKHLSGPLRGKEQSISGDCARITFGRSSSCDVVFPPEETVVGRKHFALVRKPSGDWSIDLFGDRYVEVNDVDAQPGQPVPKDATIRLGTEKGPSFQVISEPGAAAMQTGAVTAPQKERVPLPVRLRQHRRTGIAAFLVLLVAGLGWIFYDQIQKQETSERLAAIDEEYTKISDGWNEIAAREIRAEDQQRLRRAAFLAVQQDENGRQRGFGTAWPVGDNLLATNAHVAQLRPDILKKGGKMFVRSPGADGELFEVVEEMIHPGWTHFPKHVLEADVVIPTTRTLEGERLSLLPVYDVALLRINGTVPEDAQLKIASMEELRELEPGTPLATAGYPQEGVSGTDTLPIRATPQLGLGTIRALTDYFNLPTETADQRRLIHHSIPVAGGASGSAIIGPSGKVVGLVNAGSVSFVFDEVRKEVTRVPNAALVNFGQRADLVTDLIEGEAETALAADQTYWDQQTALFKRGAETRIPIALSAIEPPEPGAKLEMIFEEKGVLSEADIDKRGEETYRLKTYKVAIEGGVPLVFLAYPEQGGLWLFYQGEEDYKIRGQNIDQVWCPTISYTAEGDESGVLVVQGDNQDISYTFRIYKWSTAGS